MNLLIISAIFVIRLIIRYTFTCFLLYVIYLQYFCA